MVLTEKNNFMKPIYYLSLVVVFFIVLASSTKNENEFDVMEYGDLPVFTKNIGEIIEATDTFTTQVEFNNLNGQNGQQLLYIFVDSSNTGTFSFSLAVDMDNWSNDTTQVDSVNWYQWNAGSELRMTVNRNRNLFFKASQPGDKFVVTN